MDSRRLAVLIMSVMMTANTSYAFDYGFVRAPDYMDQLFGFLLLIMIPFLIGLLLSKPKDLPFSDLYEKRHLLSPLANAYRIGFGIVFMIFFAALMIGMGLQRMAEA
ncbi:hypothetical protein [Actibacterium sp. 188UL27-1]|uniref:hypothetical protein n=1 Tax=Actibacterium sp. 188UL27-1 TaxID=2786961 RepID=UPI00195CB974|nr:hypothetical protein [Actibacterium sp. 188UL27-1]MBM7068018.1 hypothetical protein [Actibacterium sp. 188UL27-1]